MSITSEEVNYLIWRYLQEEGLELASYALDQEAKVSGHEEHLGPKVAKGDLVQLLLKGIQTTELEKNLAKMAADGTIKTVAKPEPFPDRLIDAAALVRHEIPTRSVSPTSPVQAPRSSEDDRMQVQVATPASSRKPSDTPWSLLPPSTSIKVRDGVLALGTPRHDTELIRPGGDSLSLRYSIANDDAEVTTLAWTPEGAAGSPALAVGSYQGSIRIWSIDGSLLRVLSFHRAPIITLQWSKDGSYLASTDCTNATAIWDGESGDLRRSTEPVADEPGTLLDIEWIDAKTYATSLGTSISVQKVSEPVPSAWFRGHNRSVNALAFDSLSQLLASGGDDHIVNLWHGRSQTAIRTLLRHTGPITQLHWLPGHLGDALDTSIIASRLLSAGTDGLLIKWDPNTSQPVWVLETQTAIILLEVSPDNKYVALGSDTLVVYTLNDTQPELVATFVPPAGLQSLAWNQDRLIAATKEGTAIFDTATFSTVSGST